MKRVISLIFIVLLLLFSINITVYGNTEGSSDIFIYEYKNADTYEKIKDAVKIYCEKYNIENTENIIYGMWHNNSIPIVAEYNEKYIKIYITELTENQKQKQATQILKTIITELKSTIEDKDSLHQVITDLVEISPTIASIIFPMTTPEPSGNVYSIYKLVHPFLHILNYLLILLLVVYIIYFIIFILKNRKQENFIIPKKKKRLFISCILFLIVYILLGGLHGIISLFLSIRGLF